MSHAEVEKIEAAYYLLDFRVHSSSVVGWNRYAMGGNLNYSVVDLESVYNYKKLVC